MAYQGGQARTLGATQVSSIVIVVLCLFLGCLLTKPLPSCSCPELTTTLVVLPGFSLRSFLHHRYLSSLQFKWSLYSAGSLPEPHAHELHTWSAIPLWLARRRRSFRLSPWPLLAQQILGFTTPEGTSPSVSPILSSVPQASSSSL